tara:strand:- start:287 stop:409 length:123 start_codon:yes stop_codon:yes gene_type:complete
MEYKWEKPVLEEIGSTSEIVKNSDVDGSGDSIFPINLASV